MFRVSAKMTQMDGNAFVPLSLIYEISNFKVMMIFDCFSDLSVCETAPCENGGFCTEDTNGWECSCQIGFAGDFCEISKIFL